jgi:hypothetical protein
VARSLNELQVLGLYGSWRDVDDRCILELLEGCPKLQQVTLGCSGAYHLSLSKLGLAGSHCTCDSSDWDELMSRLKPMGWKLNWWVDDTDYTVWDSEDDDHHDGLSEDDDYHVLLPD